MKVWLLKLYAYSTLANFMVDLATDAANHEGSAGPVFVSFNCEVAQALPPFSVAVVSLLTVLFAMTADQFIVKIRNAPWLRGLGFRSH